jgi:hypothetical protein
LEAAKAYGQAIDKGFGPAWVHCNRAYSLAQFPNDQQKMREAMEEATTARELAPQDRGVEFNWAFIRYLLKQDDKTKTLDDAECVRVVRTVMASGPCDADLCYKAALILAATSSDNDSIKIQAISWLRRAVELGRPAAPLRSNPVFAKLLAKHPAFQELIDNPPPAHPASPLQLGLVHPPL